jgi:hypothetical protein
MIEACSSARQRLAQLHRHNAEVTGSCHLCPAEKEGSRRSGLAPALPLFAAKALHEEDLLCSGRISRLVWLSRYSQG